MANLKQRKINPWKTMLLKLVQGQIEGAVLSHAIYNLFDMLGILGNTCLQCSVNISLIELPLCKYKEVISFSPSPGIICEMTSCRQNFLFQKACQSRGDLQVNRPTFCQHNHINGHCNMNNFWNSYTFKYINKQILAL